MIRDNVPMVGLLLNYYSDPNQYDELNRSPLYYAVKNKNYRIMVKLLVAKALPIDAHFDLRRETDDYLCKRMLSSANFVIFALNMNPSKTRFVVWPEVMGTFLDRLSYE